MICLLAKAALASLPTAHFVVLMPPFPCRQTQCVQVFRLMPALFCQLFAGLGNTNKSAASLRLSLSPFLSLLPQTLLHIWQELSSLSFFIIRYNGYPDTHFSLKTMRLLCWICGARYSCFLQSRSLYPLTSHIHSFLGLEAYCLVKVIRHSCPLSVN